MMDIGTEWIDEKQGWTDPVKNATFAQRAAVYALSLGLNLAEVETDFTEVLAIASAPLLAKSIKRIVQAYGKGFSFRRGTVRRVSPTVSAPLGKTRTTSSVPRLVSF